MSKIENSVEIIQKMIYEENKDIDYVSKWLRIPIKSLIYVWTYTINGLIIEARMLKLKIS